MINGRITQLGLFNTRCKDLDDLLSQLSSPLRSHSRRVAVCSSIMAEYAGEFLHYSYDVPIATNLAPIAHLGGTCHDIGKLYLPALRAQEDDYLRHTSLGVELLDELGQRVFDSEIEARIVLDMVRFHHEKPNGGGFPDGLHGADIPIPAGICALADWLDHRLWKEYPPKYDFADIFHEVKLQTGTMFCEIASTSFEYAWPRLMDQYARWEKLS